jgi:hypothetical protein
MHAISLPNDISIIFYERTNNFKNMISDPENEYIKTIPHPL